MIEMWAEAGPCDNSVKQALKYVRAISEAGANAIKVQWYNADTLVVSNAARYDKTGGAYQMQYDMFKGAIYPYSRWDPVMDLCKDLNLRFIPSVFDLEAVDYAYTAPEPESPRSHSRAQGACMGARRLSRHRKNGAQKGE